MIPWSAGSARLLCNRYENSFYVPILAILWTLDKSPQTAKNGPMFPPEMH